MNCGGNARLLRPVLVPCLPEGHRPRGLLERHYMPEGDFLDVRVEMEDRKQHVLVICRSGNGT